MYAVTIKRPVRSSFILLLLGLIFFVVGVGLAVGFGYWGGQELARLKRMEPQSFAALTDARVGREVLLEGRISADMPAQFRDYVAFIHEVDTDTRLGKESWSEVERVTPPLVIDLADGKARIDNSDYQFGIMQTTTEGNDKYRGVKVSDPVVVLGVLSRNDDGIVITADTLAPGTRASYISNVQTFQIVFIAMGVVFALIGALLGGLGVLAVLRGQRRIALRQRSWHASSRG